MKVLGKTETVCEVEIHPYDVVANLLKEGMSKLSFKGEVEFGRLLKFKLYMLDGGEVKLEEEHVKPGVDLGHYETDDEILHIVDRTDDYPKERLEYLYALKTVVEGFHKYGEGE